MDLRGALRRLWWLPWTAPLGGYLLLLAAARWAVGEGPPSALAGQVAGAVWLVWPMTLLALPVALLLGPLSAWLAWREPAERPRHLRQALLLLSYLAGACLWPAVRASHRAGLKATTARLEPALATLRESTATSGQQPENLAAVGLGEDRDLPTGCRAYPYARYQAHVYAGWPQVGAKPPWAIYWRVPHGWLNRDLLVYFPTRLYPDEMFGGRVELLGDWAYVQR